MLLLPLLLCRTFQDQGHSVVIVGKWATTREAWLGGKGLREQRDALLARKRL